MTQKLMTEEGGEKPHRECIDAVIDGQLILCLIVENYS